MKKNKFGSSFNVLYTSIMKLHKKQNKQTKQANFDMWHM
jgi:hypothetical protein